MATTTIAVTGWPHGQAEIIDGVLNAVQKTGAMASLAADGDVVELVLPTRSDMAEHPVEMKIVLTRPD